MIDVGSAVGYLLLDFSGWNKGISSAKMALNTFLDETATATDKANALGSAMQNVGVGLTTTVTAPLVGLGAAAVKTAADFEQSMAQVAAVAGLDKTGAEFEALSEKAKQMGANTKFSASEAANAFNYMAMAGWDASQMMDGIAGIMDLAAASGEDLALTSDIVTDALTGFGLAAADSSHFADVLAAASNSANTNVSMLGESFKYVAPVAGSLGFTVEDVSVALGLMANSGIKASQAGTSLRSLFTNLVRPTGQAEEAINALGISVTNMDGTMKPLNQIMLELRDTFGGLTDAQKAQYAAMLAGQEGMSGFLAIVNASDADFQKLTENINNADGTAHDMAETMMDTTEGAITQLKSALESLAIEFGEVLIPMVTDFVRWLTGVVAKFNEMDDGTKKLIVTLGLVAAALGPVMTTVGTLIKVFTGVSGVVRTVISTVSQLAGAVSGVAGPMTGLAANIAKIGPAVASVAAPVAAVVAVVVALGAAFKHLWDTSEQFRETMTGIWEGIKSAFESFTQGIVDRINELGFDFESFGELVAAIWDGITQVLQHGFIYTFENIADILNAIFDVILGILDVFVGLFTGDWEQLWNGLVSIVQAPVELIANIVENFLNMLSGVADTILGFFGTSLEEVWQAIVDGVTGAVEAVGNGITAIGEWFASLPELVGNAVSNAVTSIGSFAASVWDSLVNGVSNAINTVGQFFAELPNKIAYALGYAVGTIQNWVAEVVTTLSAAIPKLISDIGTWFSELPGRIGEWLDATMTAVGEWFTNMWTQVTAWLGGTFTAIAEWFMALPGAVREWLSSVLTAVVDWGTNLLDTIGTVMGDFFQSIVDWLAGIPGAFKEWFQQALDWLASLPEKLYEIGANMLQSLWDGMVSIVTGLFDWIGGVIDQIKSIFSSAKEGYKDATSAAARVSGSYASGLDYVPRNMNVTVHEGERIMTKQENREYSRGGGGGNGYAGPDTIHFDLSIPMDGEVVARKSYDYHMREGVLRGDDLVEGGASG